MDLILIKLVALLRPVLFVETGISVGGFSVFELAGIGLTALLLVSFSVTAVVNRRLMIAPPDVAIALFVIWAVFSYAINRNEANLSETARIILPLITYVIAANVIRTEEEFLSILRALLIGFGVIIAINALYVASGRGIQTVSYWTGIPRYEGVYAGPHTMSHNMVLFMIVAMIYAALMRKRGQPIRGATRWTLGGIALGACYALFLGRVRTALVGLGIFVFGYLWKANRKYLFIGAGLVLLVTPFAAEQLMARFLPDVQQVMDGKWDSSMIGSNRFNIWGNNLSTFADQSVEHIVAGIGPGASRHISEIGAENIFVASHNDFLKLLVETGVVGLLLYATVFLALFRGLSRLEPEERALFRSLLVAVVIMNIVSNSYVARFGLGQMFFIIMGYAGRLAYQGGAMQPVPAAAATRA